MTSIQINTSGSNEYPNYLRILVAGQPGVGKTFFASKFPNPLWINAGCGISTLARIGDIPYINVSNEMDLFAVKQLLDRDSKGRESLIGRPVDTLVVDTVDELQRLLLVERLKNEKRSETKMEDWGWLNSRFHAIFAGLVQLPVNVVFVSHTKDVNVGDDTIFKPALAGQFCEHIHEYVDMSLWMRASTFKMPELEDINVDGSSELQLSVSVKPTVSRWLLTTPFPEAEWVNDKTGTLPFSVEITDDVFDVIQGHVRSAMLSKSSTFDVEIPEQATEVVEEPVVEQTEDLVVTPNVTDDKCSSCGNDVGVKSWSDLSKMRFGVVLCGDCYKNKG